GPDAAGHGEPGGLEDAALQLARRGARIAVEALRAGEVAVGLVEVALDGRRDRAAAREDLLGEAAVDLRVALEDHGLRAEPPRLAQRHPRAQPEAARLVGARRDHARADDDGPSLETRVPHLLDRREEGVDVDVEDDRRRRGFASLRCLRHQPSSATESSFQTRSAPLSWSWYTSPLSTETEK